MGSFGNIDNCMITQKPKPNLDFNTKEPIENDRFYMCLALILLDVLVMVGGFVAVVACFCTFRQQITATKTNETNDMGRTNDMIRTDETNETIQPPKKKNQKES